MSPCMVVTVKLPESEGVRENDFYWLFPLNRRNKWGNRKGLSHAVLININFIFTNDTKFLYNKNIFNIEIQTYYSV